MSGLNRLSNNMHTVNFNPFLPNLSSLLQKITFVGRVSVRKAFPFIKWGVALGLNKGPRTEYRYFNIFTIPPQRTTIFQNGGLPV